MKALSFFHQFSSLCCFCIMNCVSYCNASCCCCNYKDINNDQKMELYECFNQVKLQCIDVNMMNMPQRQNEGWQVGKKSIEEQLEIMDNSVDNNIQFVSDDVRRASVADIRSADNAITYSELILHSAQND